MKNKKQEIINILKDIYDLVPFNMENHYTGITLSSEEIELIKKDKSKIKDVIKDATTNSTNSILFDKKSIELLISDDIIFNQLIKEDILSITNDVCTLRGKYLDRYKEDKPVKASYLQLAFLGALLLTLFIWFFSILNSADSSKLVNTAPIIQDTIKEPNWEIEYFIDEFRLPTKEAYLRNTRSVVGIFSNSVANNEVLTVDFIITDKDSIYIKLYEYGTNLVKDNYSSYNIALLDSKNKKYNSYIHNYGDRLFLSKEYSNIIHKAMYNREEVKVKIYTTKYGDRDYLFTIDSLYTMDYKDCYEKLSNIKQNNVKWKIKK